METNTQGYRPQSQTDVQNVTVTTFIRPDNKVAVLVETADGETILVHPDGFVEQPVFGQTDCSDLAQEILEVMLSIS